MSKTPATDHYQDCADEHEYDNEYDAGCSSCDGSGWVFDCFDGFCADADVGCVCCERACSECSNAD